MNAPNFILQMMLRSDMLITYATDDPQDCVVCGDPRNGPISSVSITREAFDLIVASGLVERVQIDDGEWYRIRPDKEQILERKWAAESKGVSELVQ
jgi:hypothetical protein